MSFQILLIAVVHAIPVLAAAIITRNRKITTRVAQITSVVAIVTGSIEYAIVDLIPIWVAWKLAVFMLPKPVQVQVQLRSLQSNSGLSGMLPEPAPPRIATQAQSRLLAQGVSRNALPIGSVLHGVYTVEGELGHGGVGVVYRARHQELGPVAVKEYLPEELAVREGQSVHPLNTNDSKLFEEGLERFIDEARQLIRFRTHPNVVSCRDFFRDNGTAYLVMDLEEGMTLAELLFAREVEARPFDQTDLLTVTIPLLEGLDRVHEAGVLHRDIKPANILIRRKDNSPVLINFGAAKQELALHSKSFAPFSQGYAALEQVAGGVLGPWTDMYGVGAVMWRMVAGGNKPFDPPNPMRAEQRAYAVFQGEEDPMPSARTLGQDRFSPHILEAIDQCLALREGARVQGCKEVLSRME